MKLHLLNRSAAQHAPPALPKVDARGLERALHGAIGGEVRFDTASRAIYSTDGSNYRQVPIGVVVPRSTDAIIQTMAICRDYGAPVLGRGGGTSLAGQCCNAAVVIDASKYLHKIIDVDPSRRRARVQPGLILDDLRKATEAEHKLTFGPDPATHSHCTLGGMIGNNSCGIHSVMAGRTADNVEELEILTYDGHRMRVGPTSPDELDAIIRRGGRQGDIYRRLRDLRDRYEPQIRQRYPEIPRRVSGYNLNELLPERGFNVARALVGTESTCVFFLEATMRLIHHYPHRALVVLGYPDVYHAADHVPQILVHEPIGLEGIDRMLVSFMEKKELHPKDVALLPEGNGWLMVEFGGDERGEAADKAKAMIAELEKNGDAPHMKLFDNLEEEERVWQIRESGLSATAYVPRMRDSWPGWEDAAVPPDRVGGYLRDFRDLMQEFDYEAALYGHFGDGCIHCRITFDLITHAGIEKYKAFIERAAELVDSYGGSFSGEHGDGQARAELLPKMYGPELMDAFREFKSIWDPDWRMNPGKVVDPHPLSANLRLGPQHAPATPETHFAYKEDGGSFAHATLRCVGVGKCRRTDNVFMCPSFLVTREEEHTTRGRARALFEMSDGRFIHSGWRSKAVKQTLDLCLGCKGCKRECPVDVDMATYKAEFLSHHYHRRLRPRYHYAMGHIGRWSKLARLAPRVANFFSQSAGFSRAAKFMAGVAQERHLPEFAPQTFTDWFRQHHGGQRANSQKGGGKPVVLLPDVFNNCFFPDVLKAGADVLGRLDYRVRLPLEALPAIRPLIHYGMLNQAKKRLAAAVRQLAHSVRAGVPLVGFEPSTVSVFREELPNLFPHDLDGKRVHDNCFLLSEFLIREGAALPKLGRKAVYHGHCHQKAVLDAAAAREVLHRMEIDFDEPEPGCCGMAGSFGYEYDHYEISVQIAERNLLPTVRDADQDRLIIADGFSCREQISHGAGRRALHLAEVLQLALEV